MRSRWCLAADADAHVIPLGRRYGYTTTNNITLIREIIRPAVEPGFVLIGTRRTRLTHNPDRRPCHGPPVITAVVRYEADAVAHLLDAGHLNLGGSHTVQYGDRTGPAVSVLVPKAAPSARPCATSTRPIIETVRSRPR